MRRSRLTAKTRGRSCELTLERTVESGFGLIAALEASQRLRILGNLVRQELQGDKTVQLYVLGFVDDTHSTAAELLDDAIVRDGLADHVPHMLWRKGRQVNAECGVVSVSKVLAKNRHYAQNPRSRVKALWLGYVNYQSHGP
jgi:hypothetical protein